MKSNNIFFVKPTTYHFFSPLTSRETTVFLKNKFLLSARCDSTNKFCWNKSCFPSYETDMVFSLFIYQVWEAAQNFYGFVPRRLQEWLWATTMCKHLYFRAETYRKHHGAFFCSKRDKIDVGWIVTASFGGICQQKHQMSEMHRNAAAFEVFHGWTTDQAACHWRPARDPVLVTMIGNGRLPRCQWGAVWGWHKLGSFERRHTNLSVWKWTPFLRTSSNRQHPSTTIGFKHLL